MVLMLLSFYDRFSHRVQFAWIHKVQENGWALFLKKMEQSVNYTSTIILGHNIQEFVKQNMVVILLGFFAQNGPKVELSKD